MSGGPPRNDDTEKERAHPDLSGVRAVYFDLDDTLCAYWEASKFALFRAFERHGPPGFTPQEMIQHWATAFRGFGPTLKKTDWYPTYLKTGEPTRTEQMRLALLEVGVVDDARAKALGDYYAEERNRALRLFEDTEPVLKLLAARMPLGLITNGPADVQRQEIGSLGIEKYFKQVFIEGEIGEGKPLRAVFDRAAEAMGFQGPQLLFVGNSYHHDVLPALQAGWRAVWVRRSTDVPPSGTAPEAMPPGAPAPDATINDLNDLLMMMGMEEKH